jgi:flavin-dependent dehydrogenase
MRRASAASYLVAGAGPAGLTVARLLALRGRHVVILSEERREASRLELLPPGARRIVEALGLEPVLKDRAIARRCLGIHRPEARAPHEDFLGHPDGDGHVVNRANFDAFLREAALTAGAEILPLRVTGPAPQGAALRVRSTAGAQGLFPVEGILIDATGRAAAIARRSGARIAFRERTVAELLEEVPASAASHEVTEAPTWLEYRSTASDWSYRIEGPRGRTQTWRIRPPGPRLKSAIRSVDASSCILSQAAGSGWIAVGDAAMSFNPIASQGLFNALSSGLAAAGLLLSQEGLSSKSADDWSAAVSATFVQSELGRARLASFTPPSGIRSTATLP